MADYNWDDIKNKEVGLSVRNKINELAAALKPYWSNYGPIAAGVGAPNGIAGLGPDAKIFAENIPDNARGVIMYATKSNFPASGVDGVFYLAKDTGITYRWDTTIPDYAIAATNISLGATSTQAYWGDKGQTAYDHSQTNGNPHGTTAAQVGAYTTGQVDTIANGLQTDINNLTVPRSRLTSDMSKSVNFVPQEDGATGGGVVNDRPAFVLTDAKGSWVIPDGSYLLSSSWTPTNTVRFSPKAKLIIPDGVVVDFTNAQPEIHGPHKQRFYFTGAGTGSVVNLLTSHAGWFCGDNLGTTTNSLVQLNKWAASTVSGGDLRMPIASVYSDGSDYITIANGSVVRGVSKTKSRIIFLGAATKGFHFTTASRPEIHNVALLVNESRIPSTGGEGILFDLECSEWAMSGVLTGGLYIGIKSFASRGHVWDVTVNSSLYSGIWLQDCVDCVVQFSSFAATGTWLTLTGVTGTFQAETVTFPGGGSGTITTAASGGRYSFITQGIMPVVGTVLTGSTSGATGTISVLNNGHQFGAVKLGDQCEAHTFDTCEFAGGEYGLYASAISNTPYHRGLENHFNKCYFDNNKTNGSYIGQQTATKFTDCWWSCRPGDNCTYIVDSTGVSFINCSWINFWKRAMLCTATAQDIEIIGGWAYSVNRSATASNDIFLWAAGSSGMMRDVYIGRDLGFGSNGNLCIGVRINTGCVLYLDNVNCTALTAAGGTSIADGSGGTAKINKCPGYVNRNGGNASVTFDASGNATIAHGCATVPTVVNVRDIGSSANEIQLTTIGSTTLGVRLRTTAANANVPSTTINVTWEAICASAIS